MNSNRIKHITIIGFLALLVTPSILYVLNNDIDLNIKQPIKAVKVFRTSFTNNYGFKQKLLDTYLDIKSNTLNDEKLQNRVVKGNNNWWFLGNHYNNSLNNVFGNTKYSENDIYNISNTLTQWSSYFKRNKIDFYVVVPPNKNKVYKEELPFSLKSNPTKVSVLSNRLKKINNLNFIDLTESIISRKKEQQLYMKTDTHWNSIGAYYGYKKIIDEINNEDLNVTAEKLSNYKINYDSNYAGDIPRMIKEEDYSLNIKTSKIKRNSINTIDELKIKQTKNLEKELSVLVYHDSFMLAMMTYMSETFNTTTFLKKQKISVLDIEKHKPDIVILEIVERNLDILLKLKKPLN